MRPRPARQCTASEPAVCSAMRKKASAISSEGVEQSMKKRSGKEKEKERKKKEKKMSMKKRSVTEERRNKIIKEKIPR